MTAASESFERQLRAKINTEEAVTWKEASDAYIQTLDEVCPKARFVRRPWLDAACLELIEERRKRKKEHDQGPGYRELCKRVKTECRQAKRRWFEEIASEAEAAAQSNRSKELYRLTKKLTGKKTTPSIGIKDGQGNVLQDKGDILQRWHEYASTLFERPTATDVPPEDPPKGNEEPEVLLEEIRAGIKRLKNGKATGGDQVPAEAIKAGGETSIEILKNIIDKIWHTGDWPEEWVTSELIVLPKVAGTLECSKHRTISLLSHASKVLLEIIRKRIATHVRLVMAEEQFGFVPGKGTSEAIIALRIIIEQAVEMQHEEELWLLFIDYKKAFDTVYHPQLWKTLTEFGFPQHLIWLMSKLYEKAQGVIRINEDKTEPFKFGKGVRQGCIVSPVLFIVVGEYIMRLVAEKKEYSQGANIGGRVVWNLRYADDTTLLATSREDLEAMAETLREESLKYGLEINAAKTNMLTVHGNGGVEVGGESITKVSQFKFLGSFVTEDGDTSTEIRIRLATARSTASDLTNIWRSQQINIKTKVQLAKSLVWSVALYGCESWTLKLVDERKISAFEMWLWRRILGISWTEHRTNQSVREEVRVPTHKGLLAQAVKRKVKKYCHWKRRPDSLLTNIIEGRARGRGRRGRRRVQWFENVQTWTNYSIAELHECSRLRKMPTVRPRTMV